MVYTIHAGHNPDGKVGCGAIGLIKESTENRKVKNELIRILRARGLEVYDATVDNGGSASDVLQKIVKKCNAHNVDLNISIHFNAGAKTKTNNKTTGVEVWCYSRESKTAVSYAEKVCKEISKLGFTNRGVKFSKGLYVLKHTKKPTILIECCFCDDPDDVKIYDGVKMAEAIATAITGAKVVSIPYQVKTPADFPVYNQARFDSTIVMFIKNAGVYTITEEKNGFGKLKSGIGWVNLVKAKRI